MGFEFAPAISHLILFLGKGHCGSKVALRINLPIPRRKKHRFFSGVVDARTMVLHTSNISLLPLKDLPMPSNAFAAPSFNSRSVLLHLHDTFEMNRLTHGLPYLNISITQQLVLEIIHRADIKTALDVHT